MRAGGGGAHPGTRPRVLMSLSSPKAQMSSAWTAQETLFTRQRVVSPAKPML